MPADTVSPSRTVTRPPASGVSAAIRAAWRRRRHLRRDRQDEDVGEVGQLLERGGVRARGRGGRGGMRAAGAQAVVERRRVDVDAVAELLVAEADGERHRAPGRLLGGGIGHVGRRVEHDRRVLGGHPRRRSNGLPGSRVRCRSPASRRSRSSVWTCMLAIATRSIAPMTTATEIACAGVVGMDVHLDERRLADHEEAVAHLEQRPLEAPRGRRPRPRRETPCSSGTGTARGAPPRARSGPRSPRSEPRPPGRAALRTRRGRTRAARRRRHRRRPRRAARRASPGCAPPTPRPRRGSPPTASSSGRSATRSAASAISRMTVSMVPSIGCCTGL